MCYYQCTFCAVKIQKTNFTLKENEIHENLKNWMRALMRNREFFKCGCMDMRVPVFVRKGVLFSNFSS
jgi:adenine C2-methylase RlmN of 23S rRNA A2503 and tRNA A37